MARLTRVKRRSPLRIPDINLTPLIDTALTLLIIFMITAHMFHNSILIQLPKSHVKEDRESREELVIVVDKNGGYFFEGKSISEETLIKKIKQKLEKRASTPIFVQGDEKTSYGKIIELVDLLKVRGGVEYVALSTEKAPH